jgi:thiol-disulfide isomerase/thioredoxin
MKQIMIAFMALALFNACDTIEGPYEETPDVDLGGDTISQVVIFELTGWDCPNCPSGHEIIHQLEGVYGESVQAIGIHAGTFTDEGNDNNFIFTCDLSDALLERFGNPTSKPMAAFNSMNSKDLSNSYTNWPALFKPVYDTLYKYVPEIYLSYEFYMVGTELHASINGEFVKNIEGTYNLSVFVVENGIEDVQKVGSDYDDEYIHNHVLRASMYNGIYGESVGNNPTIGTIIEKQYTLDVSGTDWVADSLHVIPFVYKTETNMVIPTKIIKP